MGHDGHHRKQREKGTKRTIDPVYERNFARLIESIEDWSRLTRELIIYTARKHGKRAFLFGRSPDDYAQSAIVAALEMRRLYDFDSDKTFKQFLMSAIDSDVSHQMARPIHRTVHLESRGDLDDNRPLSGYDEGKLVSGDRPDQVIDRIDAERLSASLPRELRQLNELDQTMKRTAKDTAIQLGITVAELLNMRRRIKRHFRRKRANEGL